MIKFKIKIDKVHTFNKFDYSQFTGEKEVQAY